MSLYRELEPGDTLQITLCDDETLRIPMGDITIKLVYKTGRQARLAIDVGQKTKVWQVKPDKAPAKNPAVTTTA